MDANPQRILSLADLENARLNKRAVTCPKSRNFVGPIPAAFMINLSGAVILRLINYGLFVYDGPKKQTPNQSPNQ